RQVELSDKLKAFVQDRVDDEFGIAIDGVTLTISLPDEITAAMTRGVAAGVERGGFLDNVGSMARYQQAAAADAMVAAASNPGGGGTAGEFLGAGLGLAMAGQMATTMGDALPQPQAAPAGASPPLGGPPSLPSQQTFFVEMNGQQAGPY